MKEHFQIQIPVQAAARLRAADALAVDEEEILGDHSHMTSP